MTSGVDVGAVEFEGARVQPKAVSSATTNEDTRTKPNPNDRMPWPGYS